MDLESQFISFQTQILKIKDWLGRAETIVGAHSRLSEQQQKLTAHRETIKVLRFIYLKCRHNEIQHCTVLWHVSIFRALW